MEKIIEVPGFSTAPNDPAQPLDLARATGPVRDVVLMFAVYRLARAAVADRLAGEDGR